MAKSEIIQRDLPEVFFFFFFFFFLILFIYLFILRCFRWQKIVWDFFFFHLVSGILFADPKPYPYPLAYTNSSVLSLTTHPTINISVPAKNVLPWWQLEYFWSLELTVCPFRSILHSFL